MHPVRKVTAFMVLALAASVAVAQGTSPHAQGMQDLMSDTLGQAQVRVDPVTGTARFVQLPPQAMSSPAFAAPTAAPADKAMSFFRAYGSAFGVAEAEAELAAVRTVRDGYGNEHAIFKQTHKGVPVFGGELRAHFNNRGQLYAANGSFVSGLKLDMKPSLTSEQAAARAIRTVMSQQDDRKQVGAAGGLREKNFEDLTAVATALTVFRAGLLQGVPGRDHLAYEVEVRNEAVSIREFVYVDAHSGKVIDQITGIYEALNREIHEVTYPNLVWSEGDSLPTGNVDWDNEIDGAGETYNLFASMTSGAYVSYNGADATMITVNNAASVGCPNATWNGTTTNYCTGVNGDDTVAHEWGHAYTEYTNNLIYAWQSGALSESYSDIWGEVVDFLNGRGTDLPGGLRTDGSCSDFGNGGPGDNSYRWLSGEDDPAFGGAIRDMWTPTCYGDPGRVTDSQYFCDTGDSGGVHFNSGVPNHAFALMVDGGTYNGFTITGLGLTKAAHIHWAAQNLLALASNFVDQADALDAACSSLIGFDLPTLSTSVPNVGPSGEVIVAADCTEVSAINAAVEFRTPPSQCNFQPLLDPNAPALCDGLGSVQTIASEDFEGGLLPADWTASSHDVADPGTFDSPGWSVVDGLPVGASGSFAAFAPDLVIGDCGADTEAGAVALDSPAFVLPAGEVPHVAFVHWVATEAGWDGGNLKVSVNGAPWVVVPSFAYSFNPYNASINGGGNDNPLAGEEGFTGADGGSSSGSWGQSQVDLLWVADPGDTVQFRFDFGTDGCNGLVGWYVDDVRVYTCSDEAPPICGDGILDAGQSCDDGNTDSGDGCSSSCTVEDGWICTDPTTDIGNTTLTEGFEGGAVPPAGWTAVVANPLATWELDSFSPNSGSFAAHVLFDPSLVPQDEWLVSPAFTPAANSVLQYSSFGSVFWCRDSNDNCDLDVYIVVGAVGGGDDIFVGRADDSWPASYTWVDVLEDLSALLPGGPVSIGFRYTGLDGAQVNLDDIAVGEIVSSPSICKEIVEDLACGAGAVEFDGGIAASWTVIDNAGLGLVWTDIATAFAGGVLPGGGNFTGGTGEAASVSSDAFGTADFDTELRSNVFSLETAASASLSYLVNYQNYSNFDFLDVDISTDGGSSWANLVSWNEDHGGFFSAPGEAASIDLAAYLGASEVQVRWRYYDPTTFDFDWYAQVDNVTVTAADDADCDGVLDADDLCPGTVIPESVPTQRLERNRWALVDGDGVFDTNVGTTGLSFTLEDTAGCSCDQIIDALDLGAGHTRFGCSNSAMRRWVELVSP